MKIVVVVKEVGSGKEFQSTSDMSVAGEKTQPNP